tara:strand:+ start:167 stop:682 length:516 start_codon:yes stop_codon:yes gene_type:complete
MALNINGTTGISGVDGSASAPALQGSDSNTGVSFGTDTVNINTGGSTRATVDSSGNLKANSGFGSVTTIYGVRAWLKMYWNSGTPTISGSGNVSSLTDVATGDFTMNLTTAMPDQVYATCVSGDAYGQSSAPHFNVGSTSRGYSTTAITVNATNYAGTSTDIASVQVIAVR